MYAIRSYYEMITEKTQELSNTIDLFRDTLSSTASDDRQTLGELLSVIELRITSYNVCYTKLLRVYTADTECQRVFVSGSRLDRLDFFFKCISGFDHFHEFPFVNF